MDDFIVQQLLCINKQFYQTFASPFSATRRRLQPGVNRVLETIPLSAHLLDLGCGNGALARALIERGQSGVYVGVDFSELLLQIGRSSLVNLPVKQTSLACYFLQADLTSPDWDQIFLKQESCQGMPCTPFDYILCFATVHHLPGQSLRRQTLEKIRHLLSTGGSLVLSVWQFLNSARLRERIQPWESVGLTADQVEPGDYLLDWRQGGRGLRYVHHFDTKELQELAELTGFYVARSFLSDGAGGQLGLYQVWEVQKE